MKHMNYSPGYYVTYFIYCMIPVSIYVWYLLRRRNEDKLEEVKCFERHIFSYRSLSF